MQFTHQPNKYQQVNGVNINTAATVWPAASGKTIRLTGIDISVSVAVSVVFQDGNGNVMFQTPTLVANLPYRRDLLDGIRCPAGVGVPIQAVGAGAVITGSLDGIEE